MQGVNFTRGKVAEVEEKETGIELEVQICSH
jgi:hypothetical protein